MPNTRKTAARLATNTKRGSKQATKNSSVSKDTVMADDNVNSNHSNVQSPKWQKISVTDYAKRKNKVSRQSSDNLVNSSKAKGASCSVSGEVDDFITEVHQFEEDGELIQMEINDGGASVAEFESDPGPETESETESDSDGEPHCESAAEEIVEESESKSDSEVDSTKAPDKQDKTVKSNKGTKSQQKSMEDKLDNLSSTLEVMKDFFLNSGMLNNSKRDQGNTPKKRQGGGDRGKTNPLGSNSETTIYRNALD